MTYTENSGSVAKKALIATLPVMAGYLVLGFGFGVIMETKGLSILWAFLMSVFIYAGSMQYVTITLLTGGASFLTSAITTLMVNARHLFYGISMIDRYKDSGKVRPYLIFALTDETYSLLCSDDMPKGKRRSKYYFLVSLFDQCYWIAGSVLGSLVGSLFNFDSRGIDFALTALFITIFVDQWRNTKKRHAPALLGIVISVVSLLIFGPQKFLIPAMIVIAGAMFAIRKRYEIKEPETEEK